MLAHTVRSNIKNYNMRTKATKFSSLFSSAPTSENRAEIRQILKKDRTIEIELNENDDIYNDIYDVTPEEVAEYIVENPDEILVDFTRKLNNSGNSLPFFKSVNQKLFGNGKIVSI